MDNIRIGKAEKSQQMSIISRTISQIRKVKNDPDEEKVTELAFLLQACRGKFENKIHPPRIKGRATNFGAGQDG